MDYIIEESRFGSVLARVVLVEDKRIIITTGLRAHLRRNAALKILISHISDEALIALLLKDFIESTFLGQAEVLLSSNSGDSGVGDKWLVGLDGALTNADLLFGPLQSEINSPTVDPFRIWLCLDQKPGNQLPLPFRAKQNWSAVTPSHL